MPRGVEQGQLNLDAAPSTCECCGEATPAAMARHGVGLRVCLGCHAADGAELARRYVERLRRVVER